MAISVTNHHVFGTKDVAAAGTRVQLDTADHPLASLMLIAHSDNVGRVFYGGNDVASTTQKGLESGESVVIPAGERPQAFNLSDTWIDAANANDGVDFVGVRAP